MELSVENTEGGRTLINLLIDEARTGSLANAFKEDESVIDAIVTVHQE